MGFKAAKAVISAFDRLLGDPGGITPRYQTGKVSLQRARPHAQAEIEARLKATLPSPRFVALEAEEKPPADRIRVLGEYLVERWEAVPKRLEGATTAEIVAQAGNGVLPIAGWRVSMEVRRRQGVDFSAMTRAEVEQHVLSLQQAPSSSIYEGFYSSIPGNDVCVFDPTKKGMEQHQGGQRIRLPNPPRHPNGKPIEGEEFLKGGTWIRGRRHHREATKGMIHAGPGFTAHVDRIKAERKAAKWKQSKEKLAQVIRHCPDDFFDPVPCQDEGAVLQAREKVAP